MSLETFSEPSPPVPLLPRVCDHLHRQLPVEIAPDDETAGRHVHALAADARTMMMMVVAS